ncbi:MAG: hypothetical protein LBP30_07860, partial [Clostridiales Family XIII bacterium]|nr:hypothetical protein [Clostridiales Family XIII bacterium]
MKKNLRSIVIATVLPLVLAFAGAAPARAVETNVSARPEISVVNATQGDSEVDFVMILDNDSGKAFSGITADIGKVSGFSADDAFIGPPDITGEKKEHRYSFTVDVDKNASYGSHTIPVTFYYGGDARTELAKGSVVINVSRNMVPSTTTEFDVPVLDMAYKLESGDSLKANETSVLVVTVTNRGNIMLQDVQVTLALPDVMSLENSVAVQYVGYMGVSESKTVKFPVRVDKKAENKI